jgi:hypothetical protein
MINTNKIKQIIDFQSDARRGNVEKLPLGAVNYYTTDKPVIASNGEGTAIFRPEYSYSKKMGVFPSANFRVDTFIVCVKKVIKYSEMDFLDIHLDKMARQFAAAETAEVIKRIRAVEDVIYAPSDDVVRLQKFFDDLNRPVAVLQQGKIVDMGNNFNLVVRTDLCAEIFDEPLQMRKIIALWEDVGFFCDVDVN